MLYWCLDDRLLERCLKIRLLGYYSHRLLLRSLHWLPCLKRHWRLLGRLAYWLLSHHHWLLRGHKALHRRSCLSPLERKHFCQSLQLLLRCPRLLLRCQWLMAGTSLHWLTLPHRERKSGDLLTHWAYPAGLSLLWSGHSRQLYWPGLPLNPPSVLPHSVPLLGCNLYVRDVDLQCLLLGFKIGT